LAVKIGFEIRPRKLQDYSMTLAVKESLKKVIAKSEVPQGLKSPFILLALRHD